MLYTRPIACISNVSYIIPKIISIFSFNRKEASPCDHKCLEYKCPWNKDYNWFSERIAAQNII